jgi:hypothetical protein
LYGGKSWNYSKDGLLLFILDCFTEIKKKNWLNGEFEYKVSSEKNQTPEETLTETLTLI